MHRKHVKIRSAILALAAGLTAHSAFSQSYTVTDIDPTHRTKGHALNDSGVIGGESSAGYLRYETKLASFNIPYLGIGYLNSGGSSSSNPVRGARINGFNRGALGVGVITDLFDGVSIYTQEHAALFTYDGRWADLGTLPGDRESRALAVNDTGWVVGSSNTTSGSQKPFLWIPALPDILHGTTFQLPCPAMHAFRGAAMTINRDGLIGGYCGDAPYLWWNGVGYDISSWLPPSVNFGGELINISLFSNRSCQVTSIADSYAFAISCTIRTAFNSPDAYISFVSTPSAPNLTQVYSKNFQSTAIASINNQGCAVGYGSREVIRSEPSTVEPLKYCDGVITDLNDGVDLGHITDSDGVIDHTRFPPVLGQAIAINNSGEILVEADIFVMTPTVRFSRAIPVLLRPAP